MKKMLAFLLVLALAAGLLAMTATATETRDGYQVGYAKVDINPYWNIWEATGKKIPTFSDYQYTSYDIMPLPMAGYGNNYLRLAKPKLVDDNGSGKGATGYNYNNREDDVYLSDNRSVADGGENDGDGLWGTATAITHGEETLLMVFVDMIGINSTMTKNIKNAILAKCAEAFPTLTADRILINSNHTHGGVDLICSYKEKETLTLTVAKGTDSAYKNLQFTGAQIAEYLAAYKAALAQKLAEAALAALEDQSAATSMEKGTIDAGLQTEHHMNGVRHKVQTYNGKGVEGVEKPEVTYIRGSSFNNNIDPEDDVNYDSDSNTTQPTLTGAKPVSESDDKLHVLKFTFDDKDPVVLVNFRAHSTANNKSTVNALHYNISADWVSPLRYKMEQNNYRFALLYGASGNLGTGVANDPDSLTRLDTPQFVSEKDLGISSSTITFLQKYRWLMPATQYGWAIADAALALLNGEEAKGAITGTDAITGRQNGLPMTACQMGPIYSMKYSYHMPAQKWSKDYYEAAKAHDAASSVKYPWVYKVDGEVVLDETGTPVVIASQHHANHVISKYEDDYDAINLELNTVTLGNKVAFATTPIEASDRYSLTVTMDDILNGTFTDNDWDDLINEDAWGTPFVLSLTNNSSGYVPNKLAFEYNEGYAQTPIDDKFEDKNGDGKKTLSDYYTLALGSYESHSTYAAKGQGEAIVAKLNDMLRSTQPRTYVCSHCKQEKTFLPFSTQFLNGSYNIAGGHYYLWEDFTYNHQPSISNGTSVCLDLNGCTYSIEAASSASRAAIVNGQLNIMDTSEKQNGKFQGQGVITTVAGFSTGTILIHSSGEVNLYSGSLTMRHAEGYGPVCGGVISVEGTFNMYGGTVYGGIAGEGRTGTNRHGGNIYMNGGTFKMYGGTVRDGIAMDNGGNIYLDGGAVNLYGGEITGGNANNGDSIYVNGGTLTLSGTAASTTPVDIVVKNPEDRLTIAGTYTGKANITPVGGTYGRGVVIAKATEDTNIDNAKITFVGHTNLQVGVYDNKLWLVNQGTGGKAAIGPEHFDTVALAISAYTDPEAPVRLLADAQEVRLTKDLCLDLNGFDVTAVTTNSRKLICKDASTDDYSSPDADSYGTVPASANPQAQTGYLAETKDGKVSFHRYALKIDKVGLRPGDTGIYYESFIAGDEIVASHVREYGIAMSVYEAATQQDIFLDGDCKTHVWRAGRTWKTGANGVGLTGVMVQQIMKLDLTIAKNNERANIPIYGLVYMILDDGTWVTGEPYAMSLQYLSEYMNDEHAQMTDADIQNFKVMYDAYTDEMTTWDIPNLKTRMGVN